MLDQSFDTFMFLIFFVYGLAFFGMGLTLTLESGRTPALAEARVLRPLAFFGFVHGTHEWLESYLLQASVAGTQLPEWLPWLKIFLLAVSYISLLLYGIRTFRNSGPRFWAGLLPGALLMGVYWLTIAISAIITYRAALIPWHDFLDGMLRYLLAVPSAFLAALALRFQLLQAPSRNRKQLARYLTWAAIGFGVYGLTHLVVHPLDMIPARYINTETFRLVLGFPVQIIRTIVAVVITLNLLWATQETEKERQQQFVAAQHERLEALERVREELAKKEALRRELLRHVVQAQEEERARIARELHDETAQTLAAFSLDLAAMQALVPEKPDCKRISSRLQAHCKEMSRGLYRLVHDLRPAQLDDLGLVPALQFLVDQDAKAKGMEVQLEVRGHVRRLDAITETVLFRVTQEALTNVVRHAGTKQARILLHYHRQEVLLAVTDFGAGFDPKQAFPPPRGWGIAGMRERVEAVGGQLTIESEPGKGTEVKVIVHVFDLIP